MKKLINQILKFGVVGGIAFVIDYGLMVFLTEVFKLSNAFAISFTALSAFAPESLFIPLLTKYITRPATVFITSFTSDNFIPIVSIIVWKFIIWVRLESLKQPNKYST